MTPDPAAKPLSKEQVQHLWYVYGGLDDIADLLRDRERLESRAAAAEAEVERLKGELSQLIEAGSEEADERELKALARAATAEATAEILGEQVVTAECAAAQLRLKLTTAEAERDELAGALCNIWCNRYFTTRKGETLQQSRERCAAEFIDDAMIPLETFDRLIATPPRPKDQ